MVEPRAAEDSLALAVDGFDHVVSGFSGVEVEAVFFAFASGGDEVPAAAGVGAVDAGSGVDAVVAAAAEDQIVARLRRG